MTTTTRTRTTKKMTDHERAERLAALRAGSGAPATRAAKRPHAAGGTRWVVAGVSAAATVGMIGAMTASTVAATNTAGPRTVTITVEPTQDSMVGGSETAMSPDSLHVSAPADTAPATPTYTVVAAAAPAATDSGGS